MAGNKCKVVILGDSTVGKSSLLYRLKYGSFSGKAEPTIGCEFFAKTIQLDDVSVKLLLWDTAGQEVFRSFTPNFLRGAVAGIIVFDVTNRKSYENVRGWLDDLRHERGVDVHVELVGNKIDLDNIRQVTTEEGQALAREINAVAYRETSAKSGYQVETVFEDIAVRLARTNAGQAPFAAAPAGGGIDLRSGKDGNAEKKCAC